MRLYNSSAMFIPMFVFRFDNTSSDHHSYVDMFLLSFSQSYNTIRNFKKKKKIQKKEETNASCTKAIWKIKEEVCLYRISHTNDVARERHLNEKARTNLIDSGAYF